ncbi:MAG: hypothetical protein FWC95_07975 [Defluviitaleaceae bacterium]|nr:hypothetical protein [Defluviitaleaceae bacterium]
MNKKILIAISVLVIAFSVAIWQYAPLFRDYIRTLPVSRASVERTFRNNQNAINTVKTYLVEHDYADINIFFFDDGWISMVRGTPADITDASVARHLNSLGRRGFTYIGRHGNLVAFNRWEYGEGRSGLVFSINGTTPGYFDLNPTMLHPIIIDALNVSGWYYYEENHFIWRYNRATVGINGNQ